MPLQKVYRLSKSNEKLSMFNLSLAPAICMALEKVMSLGSKCKMRKNVINMPLIMINICCFWVTFTAFVPPAKV